MLIESIYNKFLEYYGPQKKWWPGEGLEIALGAILTQQTTWTNVETALNELRMANCTNLECLIQIPIDELESLIYSSGFYRIKARRIKALVHLFKRNPEPTRAELLELNGIGPETADSILCYLFEKPFFVIDAYTFRIAKRIDFYLGKSYKKLQQIYVDNLPVDVDLYQEYHALIVEHAKKTCKRNLPLCSRCPIITMCKFGKSYLEI